MRKQIQVLVLTFLIIIVVNFLLYPRAIQAEDTKTVKITPVSEFIELMTAVLGTVHPFV